MVLPLSVAALEVKTRLSNLTFPERHGFGDIRAHEAPFIIRIGCPDERLLRGRGFNNRHSPSVVRSGR